ncbi:hypothetical protein Tco_0143676 [Tanacetum coccineum]
MKPTTVPKEKKLEKEREDYRWFWSRWKELVLHRGSDEPNYDSGMISLEIKWTDDQDDELKALEDNFSELRQTNQYAEALSSIPSIVDQYLANKMQEAVDVAKLGNRSTRVEVSGTIQRKQHVHAVAANLSELEAEKRFLIDKMEANNSINRSDIQMQLYKALVDWITVRRDDDVLYKFKEGDFHRLRIQDIEDMLLLLVQGKVKNLNVEERIAFNVSLRMFTRSVICSYQKACGEICNWGVERYQKESQPHKSLTFNTTAGNPVKKILLKLNLSDHRLFKMVVEVPDSSWLTRSIATCSYPTDKHKDIMKAQFPVIRQSPQATSTEALQARESLMKYIQTFLKKFNRISFRETPKVLLLAWEKFFEIKHACKEKQHQPEDIQELLRKLLKDVQIISEELADYINIPNWNCPAFYHDDDEDDDEEYTIAITPVLPTEEPDNSLSMEDEHLSTILEMESDEVIKSSVEDLVPIPSESEGIFDDTCDVPFCDNSPPLNVLNDHFEIFSNFNDDCTLSDDDSFENIDYVEASPPDSKLVSLEEVKDEVTSLRGRLLETLKVLVTSKL